MKIDAICAAAGLLLLSGCIVPSEMGSVADHQYNPSTGGYVPVAEAAYYDAPLYSYGGVKYYYVSGRYMYYSGSQRVYVNALPVGGYYNVSHPVYPIRTSASIVVARSRPVSAAPVLSVSNKVVVNKTYVNQTNINKSYTNNTVNNINNSKTNVLNKNMTVNGQTAGRASGVGGGAFPPNAVRPPSGMVTSSRSGPGPMSSAERAPASAPNIRTTGGAVSRPTAMPTAPVMRPPTSAPVMRPPAASAPVMRPPAASAPVMRPAAMPSAPAGKPSPTAAPTKKKP